MTHMTPSPSSRSRLTRRSLIKSSAAAAVAALAANRRFAQQDESAPIRCANLIYGREKTSVCFASRFMADAMQHTHLRTESAFRNVRLDSDELFEHPFAVMSGEGIFTLTMPQRNNLERYLMYGGFLVASAGCSNLSWAKSFRRAIEKVFPDRKMETLTADHRVYHTVYDINRLRTRLPDHDAKLEALVIEGRIVAVFSEDGLNDTANAGGDCCCCGGNEILESSKMNVNLLAYALTH